MPPSKASSIARATLGAQVAVAAMVALASIRVSQAAERCEPSVARIVSIQGLVEVQPAGATDWMLATLDDRLCFGDTVRVGELARAALALANDSVLRFDQRTTLRLAGDVETGRSLLDLLFGDVHFFSHRPRALEVDTPIANAAAEGTEFLIRARPERTEVVMLDGRVRLTTAAGEVLLASGDAGVAVAGEAPRREIVVRPRDAVVWALYYPPVLAPLAAREAPPALPQGLQRALERVAANDYAGALAALDAVPEAARDARYHTYRAGVLLHVGRVDEAAAAIERALALDPDAAEALAQRAIIAVVQNRREEALADARRAVELAPDSAPARIALSYALQAAFQLDEARAVLREAAERIPDDPLVFARLAEIELSFGDLGAAQAAAGRAVALAPGLARTQMVLGFAALTRIDIDEAKAAFQRAIELDSAEPLARLGLGLAKIRQSDLEEGRRELEIAAALDPNTSLLRSYLGKAYFEERRDPLDAAQFRIAKELDPNDPTPYFYDAIRLQTENRPVEALRSLERSIALNDNRAVYRSRLLLDTDEAVRQASLARIYDDLGFEQLGVLEAAKSLTLDPSNYSAHRALADSFSVRPRHEIARASELLQAQLLQPLTINPLQPSIAATDPNLLGRVAPRDPAFSEFSPLFERNQLRLLASGTLGNQETRSDELLFSALAGRWSLSAGQFYERTDGFRDNNDLSNAAYDAFAQVQVTPKLSLQAEHRRLRTKAGDRALNFFPDVFFDSDRIDVRQSISRFGTRYSPRPDMDFLGSFIYSDVERTDRLAFTEDEADLTTLNFDRRGPQAELQHIWRGQRINATTGINLYHLNSNDAGSQNNREKQDLYTYARFELPTSARWTLGSTVSHVEDRLFNIDSVDFLPKMGVIWTATPNLAFRAAYTETRRVPVTVNQTLEPTSIAGFNQFYDDFESTKAERYAIGVDARLSENLYAGLEARSGNLSQPFLNINPQTGEIVGTRNADLDETSVAAYLYSIPLEELAVTLSYQFEHFESDPELIVDHVATHTIPVRVRYFDRSGVFVGAEVTGVKQEVERQGRTDDDTFALVGFSAGYRLPNRTGVISLAIENLLDSGIKFQDDTYRSNGPVTLLLAPERTVLARVTLSF
jgi:tetratricopeptide (TPR) repeat protein